MAYVYNFTINRILISNLSQESKSFQKAIEDLEQEIGHANLCEKVYNAVHTSKSDEWQGKPPFFFVAYL
jgi:hypothetical protein